MPQISEEQIRWMRNRFVEITTRAETMSQELISIRQELNEIVDALARMLPEHEA
jgi:hypothetical protein